MSRELSYDRDSFLAGFVIGRMLWKPLTVDPDEVVRAIEALLELEEQEESEEEECILTSKAFSLVCTRD